MIQLKQRFPNFFSGFTAQEYNFETMEELNSFIANPPEKSFLRNWNGKEDFVRFEIRQPPYKCLKPLLMAILKESFWAIAYIKEVE